MKYDGQKINSKCLYWQSQ